MLSIVDANITITWTYDTNDADGYVIYYNSVAKTVEGGDMKEATLAGLMPGMNYSVIVRAYQDILGPPSTPLEIPVNITVPSEYNIHTILFNLYASCSYSNQRFIALFN